MSPAFPIDNDDFDGSKYSAYLWINPIDAAGDPVDQQFIDAAHAKADAMRRYRARELRDEAVRSDLIETAVHRASRAKKREPVRDFAAYLFSVFARLVDAKIELEKKIILVDMDCLEDFAARYPCAAGIEEGIDRDQILDAMEGSAAWAWSRRMLGFGVQEIAAEMNISADCLSTRMRRGLKAVQARLRARRSNERQ